MKKHYVPLLVLAVLLAFSSAAAAYGEDAVPGSADDPIVTKSYVEKVTDGVKLMISDLQNSLQSLDKRVTALEAAADSTEDTPSGQESGDAAASAGWEVIEVKAGKSLLGKEGSEIVLRSGTASALDNGKDGISDLTAGVDLKSGTAVTKNHLLLVPREDGRGIRCQTVCWVMVKGGYTIL